jgi:hypothetical protein
MRVVLLLSGLLALGAAQADEAGLKRCRALADGQARLACYDALPVAAPPATAPAPTTAPPAAPSPVAARPPPPPAPPATFGLDKPAAAPETIASTIPGAFEGWGPRQRFRLANGQVWQVADDSNGVYDLRDPQVTIRRAVLGGFVMEIEGVRRTLRVRRVE